MAPILKLVYLIILLADEVKLGFGSTLFTFIHTSSIPVYERRINLDAGSVLSYTKFKVSPEDFQKHRGGP